MRSTLAKRRQMDQSYRENEEKSLTILSPQQREQTRTPNMPRRICSSRPSSHNPGFMFVTPPGVGEVYYEALNAELGTNKELAVSDQQCDQALRDLPISAGAGAVQVSRAGVHGSARKPHGTKAA